MSDMGTSDWSRYRILLTVIPPSVGVMVVVIPGATYKGARVHRTGDRSRIGAPDVPWSGGW